LTESRRRLRRGSARDGEVAFVVANDVPKQISVALLAGFASIFLEAPADAPGAPDVAMTFRSSANSPPMLRPRGGAPTADAS